MNVRNRANRSTRAAKESLATTTAGRIEGAFLCKPHTHTHTHSHTSLSLLTALVKKLISEIDEDLFHFFEASEYHDYLFCHRWLLLDFKREFVFQDSLRIFEAGTDLVSRASRIFLRMRMRMRKRAGEGKEKYVWANLPGFRGSNSRS